MCILRQMNYRRGVRDHLRSILVVSVCVLTTDCSLSQAQFENYICFNRGLPLEEVIDQVTVSTGSSIWITEPTNPSPTLTQITPDEEGSSLMPSWGPGKSDIVFSSNRMNDGSTPLLDLWTIQPDGGALQRLTQDAGHNWTPVWSPDGTMIAFASTRNFSSDPDPVWHFDIFVMNSDGSGQRFLADAGGQDEDPVFSGDSQTVYFIAERSGCYQIWQAPVAGGEASPLLDSEQNPVCGEDISLSPNGETLFFWSNQMGAFSGLNLMTREVTFYSYDAMEPWIGPIGNRFTFMSEGNVIVSDLDGSNAAVVTSSGQDFFPRWAGPLGIIHQSPHSEPGVSRSLLHFQYVHPNPFRDSATIRFALAAHSQVEVRVSDLQGREVALLTEGQFDRGIYDIAWRADHLPSGTYICHLTAYHPTSGGGGLVTRSKALSLIR